MPNMRGMRIFWWIMLGAWLGEFAASHGGALVGLWDSPPSTVSGFSISMIAVSIIVVSMSYLLGPANEAYLLGISAGKRLQRQECAATCGHWHPIV